MRKLLIISIYILLLISNLQAQDLIVTSSGDSINCTITKITKEYTHFTFKHDSEIKTTLLPANQVIAQQKNYFTESEIPLNHVFKTKFPRLRIAIDGGWQYRIAKMASGMDPLWSEHYTKMRSGFHYDFQIACFFAENHGIEAMFTQHFFDNKLGQVYLTDELGNVMASGVLKEKITFNYVGLNYISRFYNSKKKNCFLMTIGMGYLGYIDKLFLNDQEFGKITASTVGFNLGIGYDIGISKYFSLGFKVSLMGGAFSNYKETIGGTTTDVSMPEKTSEGLGTINLSVGLRFNK
jgi:competence protein ComGC